tara:strand:+ start:885 stop:1811 length:927 start_codon:yes stop_codon:yes gene_type:complete
MLKIYQNTLRNPVNFSGIGLHSGQMTKITILPSESDKGIIFIRKDLKNNNVVEAKYDNVTSTKLCTTLENKHGVKISTVEHLLAALYIAEIDNAVIELNNEEVPIMDGSAKEFLRILKNAEIKELTKKRKYLKVINKVELKDGNKKIYIEPNNSSFEVNFHLNYENKIIGDQNNLVNFQNDDLENIYESRTFCLHDDIKNIKKIGLAKGGSLDNAIVVDKEKVLNDGGLRNNKEFVNHKILDLAGDFLLSGYRVLGRVVCHQGGHDLTNKFLRKLLNTRSAIKDFQIKNLDIPKKISTEESIKLAVNA